MAEFTIWDELEDTPAWVMLARELTERRTLLRDRLVALGRESTDPRIQGVAGEITAIDLLLTLPQRKREEMGAE